MSISQLSAPTVPVSAKYFYGIAVDPASGMVYCADPVDYVQKGFAFRYLPDGSLVDSFKVEYVPSGFVFY